jgi:hypothetical protein
VRFRKRGWRLVGMGGGGIAPGSSKRSEPQVRLRIRRFGKSRRPLAVALPAFGPSSATLGDKVKQLSLLSRTARAEPQAQFGNLPDRSRAFETPVRTGFRA